MMPLFLAGRKQLQLREKIKVKIRKVSLCSPVLAIPGQL